MRALIVEPLGDEVVVYDPESDRAYALEGETARLFRERKTDSDRRAVLRLAVVGIVSILAPSAAQACSNPHATRHCGKGESGRACERGDGSCGICMGGSCV